MDGIAVIALYMVYTRQLDKLLVVGNHIEFIGVHNPFGMWLRFGQFMRKGAEIRVDDNNITMVEGPRPPESAASARHRP